MLEVVRAQRGELVRTFGMPRRLALRIESLLGRHVACTATVLEEAVRDARLAALLLDRTLLDETIPFTDLFRTLTTRPQHAALLEDIPLALQPFDDGWTALALEEELGAPVEAAAMSMVPTSGASAIAAMERGADADAEAGVQAGADPLASLRMAVFAGETSAERVSALRKILFLPVAPDERADIFIAALAEPDAALRGAAGAALRQLGLAPEVAECLRLLAEGEPDERVHACRQLAHIGAAAGERACRCAVMAVIGALRTPSGDADTAATAAAVEVLGACLPGQAGFMRLMPDVCRLLLEQVVAEGAALVPPVRAALRRFLEAGPEDVCGHLVAEADRMADVELRAFVLSVLATGNVSEGMEPVLWPRVLAAVLEGSSDGPWTHVLGAYLVQGGEARLPELLDAVERAAPGHQRLLIRMLDNGLRARALADGTRVRLANAMLVLLRTGSWNLRADVFEMRLLGGGLPEGLATDLAREYLRNLSAYGLPHVHENVRFALEVLGAAILPVLSAAATGGDGVARDVACRALGGIASRMDMRQPASRRALEETMRVLQAEAFAGRFVSDEQWVAMGRVYATGVLEERFRGVIRRTIEKHLAGSATDAPFLRALGWMATAPGEPAAVVEDIAGLAESCLAEVPDEPRVREGVTAHGEDVFHLDGETEALETRISAALEALRHIATSDGAPEPLRHHLVALLVELWKRNADMELQWSPSLIVALTEVLGVIGRDSHTPEVERGSMVRTLGRRISEQPVLDAVAGILALTSADEDLARLAGAACTRILTILDDTTLVADDRAAYVRSLARILERGTLHTDPAASEAVMLRVAHAVTAGVREGLPGCLECVRRLSVCERLPEAVRALLERSAGQSVARARL